jgi:Kef-type K+ transport system membrane component KefB/mannitol/fructose-specific phosphotransferase system IIA component (Ntr-type)
VSQHQALVFLLSLALLLGVGRLLGELGNKLGAPIIVGEILAGVALGKSVLGHTLPEAYAWLFTDATVTTMLDAYATLGLLLLLVFVGLEVDLGVVRRRGRDALPAIVLGIALPFAGGVALGLLLPTSEVVLPERRALFAVFLGISLSLSALPTIAKTLGDLGLFKSDLGLLVMSTAMVGDLLGWLAFSIMLGLLREPSLDLGHVGLSALLAIAFAVAAWQIGRRVFERVMARGGEGEGVGARILWLVIVLALLAASGTQAIGIHAVLGGFLVGVFVGDSARFRIRARAVVRDFVTQIFAPVFFASVLLRVDLATSFDGKTVLVVLGTATALKVLGGALGGRLTGLRWREASAVGFALNARGTMEVILAVLAVRAGLISESLFVALLTMALITSVASDPIVKQLLYRSKEEDVVALLRKGAFVSVLEVMLPTEAIEELVHALGDSLGPLEEKARISVIERELVAPTGLGDSIAIPHAAVPGLTRPLLALGRAPHGIDFDAPDGKPARLIFLVLVPPKAYDHEVQILASIARAVFDARARDELMAAKGVEAAMEVLGANAKRLSERRKPGVELAKA